MQGRCVHEVQRPLESQACRCLAKRASKYESLEAGAQLAWLRMGKGAGMAGTGQKGGIEDKRCER